MKQIDNMTVRFFIWNNETDYEVKEVTELEWLGTKGTISYDRQTVFENGVRQICLTKGDE